MDLLFDDITRELIELSDQELQKVKDMLPKDPNESLGFLIESIRVLDFVQLGQPGTLKGERANFSAIDLNIIEIGWNLAASILLKESTFYGFPMRKSTAALREQVINVLYHLGVIVQLRRSVDMIKAGLVEVKKQERSYIFSILPDAKDQFLDEFELNGLRKLEEKIRSAGSKYKEWNVVDRRKISDVFCQPGNFISVRYETEFAGFKIRDIESRMIPLIKEWDAGRHGIMLAYDATPEVDRHFFAIATELVIEWVDEAGINPKTRIGDSYGYEIMTVAMFIISFHIKHIQFAYLASKKYKRILIPQSLSIWNPLPEMVADISYLSGMSSNAVSKALELITLKASDVKFLELHTTRFRPLLIDLGTGFLFRPVSSVVYNPFHSIYALAESRDPSIRDRISSFREDWLRTYFNGMFSGTRYQTAGGNFKIRMEGRIITDVDAFVYDNVTGELAIIQIKWQNYFTNDVRKLRSRAKNFVEEMHKWGEKMERWTESVSINQIAKTFKLRSATSRLTKSKIYLFGLSKNAARMQGYGYPLENKKIALSTWAQFVRNRTEVGPASFVISKLFQNLKEQESLKVQSNPIPFKVQIGDLILNFKDLWSVAEDK